MSESTEDLGISLDSSIKKLLKSQFPNQSFRNPVVKAIAICAQKVFFFFFFSNSSFLKKLFKSQQKSV